MVSRSGNQYERDLLGAWGGMIGEPEDTRPRPMESCTHSFVPYMCILSARRPMRTLWG